MKTKHIQLYYENKLIKEAKKKKGEKRRRKETENQNSKTDISNRL